MRLKSNQFDVRNPEYLQRFQVFACQKSLKQILDPIKLLGKKDLIVGDLMCGTGKVGKTIFEQFGNYISELYFIDGSEWMLSSIHCKKYWKKTKALSEDLPFGCDTFDVIVCRYGFNNIEKHQYLTTLKECLRVLQKKGILIIQDLFGKDMASNRLINKIERTIALCDGRNDAPYNASVLEMNGLISESGGELISQVEFWLSYSIEERFRAKDANQETITRFKQDCPKTEMKNLQVKEVNEDLHVSLPITTLVIKKQD